MKVQIGYRCGGSEVALRAEGGEPRCALAAVSLYSILFFLNLDHFSEESFNSGIPAKLHVKPTSFALWSK